MKLRRKQLFSEQPELVSERSLQREIKNCSRRNEPSLGVLFPELLEEVRSRDLLQLPEEFKCDLHVLAAMWDHVVFLRQLCVAVNHWKGIITAPPSLLRSHNIIRRCVPTGELRRCTVA